jgi:hypothetical protein
MVAKELGEIRNLLNERVMQENPGYRRGDREDYASEIGILGELIARFFLVEKKIDFRAAPLVARVPLSKEDVSIGGQTFDVKTVREDAPDLLVNVSAHAKNKCDFYWFIRLVDQGTAEHFVFSSKEVSSWPVKSCKYTDAHYRLISEIARAEKEAA